MTARRWMMIAILTGLVTGCIGWGDAANRGRTIRGPYRLVRWEGGPPYYVYGPGDNAGGGAIGGTVERIGWSDSLIIAERRATFGGVVDGWMVINVNAHSVAGPVSDEAIAAEQGLAGIKTIAPAAAYDSLGQ